MKTKFISLLLSWLLILPLAISPSAEAEDSHDHEHEEHEGHEAHEEDVLVDPTTVGPRKGVIAKSHEGFQLAPEAEQTFKPRKIACVGSSLEIPRDALVRIKSEKSVYRFRAGWIKRIAVKVQPRPKDKVVVQSTELKAGDEVIISGVGFLRVTEVFIEGGANHGHSH